MKIDKDSLHWGEELEFHIYSLNDDENIAKLSCDFPFLQEDFDAVVAEQEIDEKVREDEIDFTLNPEFGSFMVETVPTMPYGLYSNPEVLL